MGFYDCRCMVSGVSLKGADCALVLLEEVGRGHRPVALAITGNYNRLGSIDGIDEDDNTELVLRYFLDRLKSGEFVVDEDYCGPDHYPITDVEGLLWAFERNQNDDPTVALLGGRPIKFALISRAVWNAIARAHRPDQGTPEGHFQELFAGVPIAEQTYRGRLEDVSQHLPELSAVNAFLTVRQIRWSPPKDLDQHYTEEMRKYLAAARRKFRDSSELLQGLDAYKREVGDLLDDD
jgi:hypothetical protein